MKLIFFIILYTFSILYLAAGIHVLFSDKNSRVNRLFLLVFLCAFLWSFGYACMYISPNKQIANIWRMVAALGWCFFYAIWLDFAITIKKGERISNNIRIIVYLGCSIFFLANFRYNPEKVIKHLFYGWGEIYPPNLYEFIFVIYFIIVTTAGVIIMYSYGKKSKFEKEKKQSKIVASTSFISLTLLLITDKILPSLGYNVYPFGILFLSIAVGGAGYAITKYKMLMLTNENVSEYLYKSVNNPIFFLNEDLNIVDANTAALKMTGYNNGQIHKLQLENLICNSRQIITMLKTHNQINNLEVQILDNKGDIRECTLSLNTIYDEFNDKLGTVLILQDISDRKETERILKNYNHDLEIEIKQRTEALERANNSKSEFLATISHEFKTPLNVILSAIQLFNMYCQNDSLYNKENAKKHLKSMKQNCLRLVRLVNNIIDTTKLESGYFNINIKNHDIVNITRIITESVEDYTKQRGTMLYFKSDFDKKIICCDDVLMERILLNLLSNSIKFTRENSKIIVRITKVEEFISISVKDNGIGISKELLNEIFERYKQADNVLTRENEGSGIGLAIVKNLVELQGGHILVKSKLGHGSEFIVMLRDKIDEKSSVVSKYEYGDLNYDDRITDKINVEFSDIYDIEI